MHGNTDEFKWSSTSSLLVLLLLATSPSTVSTEEDCPGNSDTPYVLACNTTSLEHYIPWEKWVDKCVVPKAVINTVANYYASGKLRVKHGKLNCTNITNWTSDTFYISELGWFGKKFDDHSYGPGKFCIGRNDDNRSKAFVCVNETSNHQGLSDTLTNSMFLSLPFFILTILVYALIKELRDLHGKCLICHVFSLFMAFISLFFSQDERYCKSSVYGVQFFFIASFYWLNVMSIDLLMLMKYGKDRRLESKRFIKYSIYVWVSCFIIFLFTYYAQYLPKDHILQPKTERKCGWFGTKLIEAVYYYGIVGALLLTNILIMGYIAINVYMFSHRMSNAQRALLFDKHRLRVCFELITVMGLNWVLDFGAWIFDTEGNIVHYWFGEIVTFANALLGLAIFVIFVCKTRVLSLISECFEDRFYVSVNTTNRSNTMFPTEMFNLDQS